MIHLPRRTKPALAAAFLLLLAAEWLLPGPQAPALRTPPALPAATPDASADAQISQWASTALARPLFNADRRPVEQPGTESDALPRLSAIIITGSNRAAIFDASGQKPQIVPEGGEIDGYRLQHIAPGTVDLLGPDGPVTLRPRFASPDPTTPTAMAEKNF